MTRSNLINGSGWRENKRNKRIDVFLKSIYTIKRHSSAGMWKPLRRRWRSIMVEVINENTSCAAPKTREGSRG